MQKIIEKISEVFNDKRKLAIFVSVIAVIVLLINTSFKISPLQTVTDTSFYGEGFVRGVGGGDGSLAIFNQATTKATRYEGDIYPYPVQDVPSSSGEYPNNKKIIKNGNLNVVVTSAEDTSLKIENIAEKADGFVENSNIYEVSDGVKSGYLTVRVPSEKFASVIKEIKKLALKVENESVNSSDVTALYVDLEARISNLKSEEKQYQEVMKKATKVEDILQVTKYLSSVRGEIERYQGELNLISRQVSMSLITVNMTSQAEIEVFGIVWRPLTEIKIAFKNFLIDLTGLVNDLIIFVFKLPIFVAKIIFVVVLVIVGFKAILYLLKRFSFIKK